MYSKPADITADRDFFSVCVDAFEVARKHPEFRSYSVPAPIFSKRPSVFL